MAVLPERGTPRPRRTRNPNYRSSIYQTKDGYWHGRVTIGTRDDGQPDRRHVGGKTRSEVAEKVRALERERDRGTARKAGERWTVARWLTYWVENIAAPPHVAENTHNGYLVDVKKHLIPGPDQELDQTQFVPAAEYKVTVTVGEEKASKTVRVLPAPNAAP